MCVNTCSSLGYFSPSLSSKGAGSLVVKAACLEGLRSRVRTPLLHSSFTEKQNVSSLLTCKDLILWGASSLAYMCTKIALDPIHYIFISLPSKARSSK